MNYGYPPPFQGGPEGGPQPQNQGYPQAAPPAGQYPPAGAPQGYPQAAPQVGQYPPAGVPQGYPQAAPPVGQYPPIGAPQGYPQAAPPVGQYPPAGAPQGYPQAVPPAGQYPPAGVPQAPSGWGPVYGYPVYGWSSAPVYTPPVSDPRRKGASQTLNRMCVLSLLQTVSSFVWSVPLTLLLTAFGVNMAVNQLGYQWLSGVLVLLSTALPFVAYLIFQRKDPVDYFKFEKVGFSLGLLCVLAGLGVVMLGNYPAMAVREFFGIFGYQSPDTSLGGEESLLAILAEIFVTAMLVPVMEELVFRGVVQSALRRYGTGFSIAASALVFGLAHMDPSSVVFATIAGLVFGFLYARTNNLWLPILIHVLNNLIATLGTHTDYLFGSMAGTADTLLMLLPIAVGVLALILLVLTKRKLLFAANSMEGPAYPLRAGESAAAIVRTPMFWVGPVGIAVLYTLGSIFLG